VELEEQRPELERRGYGLAALSYDSPEVLAHFARRRDIRFPLLSDPGSEIIRRFGLLNARDYAEGDLAWGVPYPGTLIVDAEGVVRGRFFEEAYAERRTAASLLLATGDAVLPPQAEQRTHYFRLRTGASNAVVRPGWRISLLLDFEVEPGHYVYAPGTHPYAALRLELEPHPLVRLHDTVYPESSPFHFEPLDETVPVFRGRFRLLRDVTLGDIRALSGLLQEDVPVVTLAGRVHYQVCTERKCYAPASLPVSWTLRVAPPDRERVPEALRRPVKP
jgi:hypothetical protein